jgi:hypothetical protein
LNLEVTIKKGEMRGADGIQIEAGWHITSEGSLERRNSAPLVVTASPAVKVLLTARSHSQKPTPSLFALEQARTATIRFSKPSNSFGHSHAVLPGHYFKGKLQDSRTGSFVLLFHENKTFKVGGRGFAGAMVLPGSESGH